MIAIKVATALARGNKMGFRKPMDYNQVHHQIYMSGVEMRSKYNDGFTQWEIKKDLLEIKYLLDEIVETSPTFSGEQEYFEEQAKRKTWKILNVISHNGLVR